MYKLLLSEIVIIHEYIIYLFINSFTLNSDGIDSGISLTIWFLSGSYILIKKIFKKLLQIPHPLLTNIFYHRWKDTNANEPSDVIENHRIGTVS